MKRVSAVMAILAAIGTSAAGRSEQDGEASVTVYICHDADMQPGTLSLAQAIARAMFAKAGVHLIWRARQRKIDSSEQLIVVDLTSETPDGFHRGTLAYAQPYEGVHIRVFYDRVERMAGRCSVARLLAHVLVHEITHMLEGMCRHSPEGVMKAQWTGEDMARMAQKPLSFDPSDIEWIHLGLPHREQVRNTIMAAKRYTKPTLEQHR